MMLILGRKPGQKIVIGRNIFVTVLNVSKFGSTDHIELGIEAPHDIEIHREEVMNRIILEEKLDGKH